LLFFLFHGLLSRIHRLELGACFLKWVIQIGSQVGFRYDGPDFSAVQQKGHQIKKELLRIFKEIETNNPFFAVTTDAGTKGIFTGFLFEEFDQTDNQRLVKSLRFAETVDIKDIQQTREVIWGYIQTQSILNQTHSRFYSTSDHLSRLIIKILQPSSRNSLCDMGSGWGLLGARILMQNPRIQLSGQEKELAPFFLSIIHFFLMGFYHTDIVYGDLIENPKLFAKDGLRSFDAVVGDLPIAYPNHEPIKRNYPERFPVGMERGTSKDWLFALHALHVLQSDGIAVLALSTASLNQSADMSVRKHLVEMDWVESVIEMPEQITDLHSHPRSLLVMQKKKDQERKGKVLMIDAYSKNLFGDPIAAGDWVNTLSDIYQDGKEMTGISTWVPNEQLKRQSYLLGASGYVQTEGLSKEGVRAQRLNEFASRIFRGLQIRPEVYEPRAPYQNHPVVYFWNSGDIHDPGEKQTHPMREIRFVNDNWNSYALQENDVVISARGTVIKSAVIRSDQLPAIASANILCIRLKKEVADPYYIKAFFDSPKGQMLLHSIQTGRKIKVINPGNLGTLLVPFPSIEVQKEIGQSYHDAFSQYKNAQKSFQKVVEGVFMFF